MHKFRSQLHSFKIMKKIKVKLRLIIWRVKSKQMEKLLKLANSPVLAQSRTNLKNNSQMKIFKVNLKKLKLYLQNFISQFL